MFSSTFEEHLHQLDELLQRLRAANLKPRLVKCHFAQSEVNYLGHLISSNGIQVDPDTILDFPTPTDVKHLQQF